MTPRPPAHVGPDNAKHPRRKSPAVGGGRAVPLLDQLPDGWRPRRPDWNYITAKRLVLVIERSLGRGTRWVVFEPERRVAHASVARKSGRPTPRTPDRRDRGSAAGIHHPTRRARAEPWARPAQPGADPTPRSPPREGSRRFPPSGSRPGAAIRSRQGLHVTLEPAVARLERTFRSATQGHREAPLSQETRPASR